MHQVAGLRYENYMPTYACYIFCNCLPCLPLNQTQVVVDRTKPNGRVVGIDIIPAQPPKGVSTIQGNFLSPGVQKLVKDYLIEFAQRKSPSDSAAETTEGITERPSYIDSERSESTDHHTPPEGDGRLVDVCLLLPIQHSSPTSQSNPID